MVAQRIDLGGRIAGREEVRGSSPLSSIENETAKHKDFRVFSGFLASKIFADFYTWSQGWSQPCFFFSNYRVYLVKKNNIQENPVLSGFLLLIPLC